MLMKEGSKAMSLCTLPETSTPCYSSKTLLNPAALPQVVASQGQWIMVSPHPEWDLYPLDNLSTLKIDRVSEATTW